MIESDVVNDFRLALGTMAHSWLEQKFRSAPVMNEVDVTPWMPEGWTGRLDALYWNSKRRAFALVDYKTCKPTAIPFILRDGEKDTYHWQASCYWHAARLAGFPLIEGYGILHMPIEQLKASDGFVQPLFVEGTPLPWEIIEPVMLSRWARTREYLDSIQGVAWSQGAFEGLLTAELEPVQGRVVGTYLNTKLKRPVIDVSIKPHWSAQFCPYPNELCDCSEQGVNKIGWFDRTDDGKVFYTPKPKMPQPPDPMAYLPSPGEIKNLVKAQKEKADASTA